MPAKNNSSIAERLKTVANGRIRHRVTRYGDLVSTPVKTQKKKIPKTPKKPAPTTKFVCTRLIDGSYHNAPLGTVYYVDANGCPIAPVKTSPPVIRKLIF